MLDWVLIAVAMALSGGPADEGAGEGTPASAYQAEAQTPSGKFTTAAEIRPILDATRGNWVAVREYDGQDLLYLTHLLGWRCGLHRIRYGINNAPLQDWPMPPCLTDTATPNATLTEGGLPYARYPLGSVTSVQIELLYDDLGTDAAEFSRKDVLMP